MEGNILSRFQLDIGLPNESDSDLDTSNNEDELSGQASSTEHGVQDDFPYTSAQRRQRSLSDESQVPERELKRRKEFAEKTCTELGLAPDALSEFSQVSIYIKLLLPGRIADVEQMRQTDMIIELRASIMSLKHENEKDETWKYIESEEFKDVLKDRLRCCLLSPNLTGYVIGTATNVLVSPIAMPISSETAY